MESKFCQEGQERKSRKGKAPKPGQSYLGYCLDANYSLFTTQQYKSSNFSQERIQILKVRVVKMVLKLNFKNQKDDTSLKMQTIVSPNISGFLSRTTIRIPTINFLELLLPSSDKSSPFADFNHSDKSQLLDRSNTLSIIAAQT